MRVQVPAYADAWMKGDMYGDVVKTTFKGGTFAPSGPNGTLESRINEAGTYIEIAHVKMDKSGKTLRFILDDCKVL